MARTESQADAAYQQGLVAAQANDWPAAKDHFLKALTLGAGGVAVLSNLGTAYTHLRAYDPAKLCFLQALQTAPELAALHNNLGVVLGCQNALGEAIAMYDRALALAPDHVDARLNRGFAHYQLRHTASALADYAHVLHLEPGSHEAMFKKAMALLSVQDYPNGWAAYESRLQLRDQAGSFDDLAHLPRWRGDSPIAGRVLLVRAEQGLGDTLQFCRYLQVLLDLKADVSLQVQPALKVLMQHSFPRVQVDCLGGDIGHVDAWTPLMSLPLALGQHVACPYWPGEYLRTDARQAAAWARRLPLGRLRVGVVWEGAHRPEQPELWAVNQRRNLPLRDLEAFTREPICLVSLQVGEPAQSQFQTWLAGYQGQAEIFSFEAELKNFMDTAGLIRQLDLVIAVDTSTAHLAAALGKPVWLLNRFDSCWRWPRSGVTTAWYPSMRIYTQSVFCDWHDVVQRVATDLHERVQQHALAQQSAR